MIRNRQLLLPYLAPYVAYVGIISFLKGRVSSEWAYALTLVVVPGVLIWAWRWYVPLRGPRSAGRSLLVGLFAGLAGAAAWTALLWPFVDRDSGGPWTDLGFVLRLLAAGALVPVFEELLMRGFIFRVALQWGEARKHGAEDPLGTALEGSVDLVAPGGWSWAAVAVSTVAFTVGHKVQEWPAAVAFGLLMVLLWIYRKDLLSCVAAHSTANVALAVFVRTTGNWGLW